jgi:hypothetical protein
MRRWIVGIWERLKRAMAKKKRSPRPDKERTNPDGDEKMPTPPEAEAVEKVWRRPEVQRALERILRGLPPARQDEDKQ